MKKYLNVLKKCLLFSDINEDELIFMLGCLGGKIKRFEKRETVFYEGEPARDVGIVLSGNVQISQIDYYGNRSVLGNVYEGEVFAEAFACAAVSALPVSVIANEQSDIMIIDCSHILHTCERNCAFHQKLIFNLMTDLAKKTITFHERIGLTSKRTTRDKLMAYLTLYAKKCGSNSFSIPFDRQELADYLEVDRSGLSAEISKLRREGVLESERKHFKLLSLSAKR